MKKIFKAISTLTLGLLLVSSCNVENINATYSPSKDEVSFVQSINVNTEIPTQSTTYDVLIGRNSTEKALTVNIACDITEDVVCPSSVTFQAGESSAIISLDIANMKVGKQYKGKITITDESVINKNIAISAISLTLQKVYTWNSLGEGEWWDNLALMSETSLGIQKVEVLKAEGFERYRIMKPYANTAQLAEAWGASALGGAKNNYIEFWVNEDMTVAWDGWWCPGLLYDGAGTDIKAYYPSYLTGDPAEDGKSKFVMEKVVAFYPYWYIDGLGGFGTKYPCFLSLPGGPSIESLLQ